MKTKNTLREKIETIVSKNVVLGKRGAIIKHESIKDEILVAVKAEMPKKKDFLWLAYNDDTGEERILDKKGYQELEKKEGWKWSGHAIQSGYNQALDEMLEVLGKDSKT